MLIRRATTLPLTQDCRAVTAVEYALIAGLIAVVIVGALTSLGSNFSAVFNKISGSLASG